MGSTPNLFEQTELTTRPEQAHARHTDPATSHKAAASVVNLGRTRDAIIALLKQFGPMTDEGIAFRWEKSPHFFNLPKTSPSGLRSRRSELVAMGFVEPCGTGKTLSGRDCQIWRATA